MPSSTPTLRGDVRPRKTLHIVTTIFLQHDEVLVRISDGTAAIYEAKELENLRPRVKQMLPNQPHGGDQPQYARAG